MSAMTKKNKRQKKHAANAHALSAGAAVWALDPHSRNDLICHLHALDAAQNSGDVGEQEYARQAISEIFALKAAVGKAPDLEDWERDVSSPAAEAAAAARDRDAEKFFLNYDRLKRAGKLHTIRAVAKAAGLSPTTVQAIEKQRVKPQLKTRQALAKAFHVKVDELDR